MNIFSEKEREWQEENETANPGGRQEKIQNVAADIKTCN